MVCVKKIGGKVKIAWQGEKFLMRKKIDRQKKLAKEKNFVWKKKFVRGKNLLGGDNLADKPFVVYRLV